MNHFSNQEANKKRLNIVLMFVLFLVSNVTLFGQTVAEGNTSSNTTIENNVVEKESANTSNMNFVIWFMGSKQNPGTTISPAGTNTKKQIMTSGLAPNRLLIKAFLKKAVNFEVATA